jgi:hypothetical protein
MLERGGMPAIPGAGQRQPLGPGRAHRGRRPPRPAGRPRLAGDPQLLGNRPLDYPYDIGNQEGGAFTERFFRALAGEAWGADAWRGRSLAEVNRLRYDRRNPGATIADDHACWLAYEHFDALNRKSSRPQHPDSFHGKSAIWSVEDTDPRYPATTPDLHMAQTLESMPHHDGRQPTLQARARLLFLHCLLAGRQRAAGQHQPLVGRRTPGTATAGRAARCPWRVRYRPNPRRRASGAEPPPRITLRGSIANLGAQRTLTLARDGIEVAQQTLDSTGIFEFPDLADGDYVLRMPEANFSETVTLHRAQREVVVRLTLPAPVEMTGRSAVEGYVAGGAGAVVMLVHASSGEEWVTLARDDGSYRFVDLPPGEFSLRVHPSGSHVEHLRLDGRSKTNVDLMQAGWGYTVGTAAATTGIGAVVVATPGHKGLKVQIHGAEGASDPVETGTAPEYGAAACHIGGLDEGHYIVTVDNAPEADGRPTQLEARVHIDKRSIPLVEFVYGVLDTLAPPIADSAIAGKVRGVRAGQPLRIALLDDRAGRQEQFVASSGAYAFEELGAGLYTVQVVGYEAAASAADIALDGRNRVTIDLALPEDMRFAALPASERGAGVIAAVIPEGAGRSARLVDAVGNDRRERADADGQVRFDALAVGVYSLFVDGGFAHSNLEITGDGGWQIAFAPLISVWEATVTQAGPMPGFSAIHVEIEGLPNHPVRVYQGEEQEFTLSTRSRAEQGAYAVEFKPLGPGLYRVEPDGLGVWATVELTGLEAVRVGFRRVQAPVSTNRIEPILPAAMAETPPHPSTYLYVAAPPVSLDQCLALLRVAAAQQPQIGSDLTAAAHADRVLLAPAPDAGDIAARLQRLGVVVEMISAA